MKRFIKLTGAITGKPVIVNIDVIKCVAEDTDNITGKSGTLIALSEDTSTKITVNESLEDIWQMLGGER